MRALLWKNSKLRRATVSKAQQKGEALVKPFWVVAIDGDLRTVVQGPTRDKGYPF